MEEVWRGRFTESLAFGEKAKLQAAARRRALAREGEGRTLRLSRPAWNRKGTRETRDTRGGDAMTGMEKTKVRLHDAEGFGKIRWDLMKGRVKPKKT